MGGGGGRPGFRMGGTEIQHILVHAYEYDVFPLFMVCGSPGGGGEGLIVRNIYRAILIFPYRVKTPI